MISKRRFPNARRISKEFPEEIPARPIISTGGEIPVRLWTRPLIPEQLKLFIKISSRSHCNSLQACSDQNLTNSTPINQGTFVAQCSCSLFPREPQHGNCSFVLFVWLLFVCLFVFFLVSNFS